MFYVLLGSAYFSVLFVAVIGFASVMKKDEPKAEKKELERVERSWCCFAPVEQGLMRPGTMLDPPEYGDFCTACGRACDVGTFLRDPWDGMLIEVETGEKIGEEQAGRDLDLGGPDVDAQVDEARLERAERRRS